MPFAPIRDYMMQPSLLPTYNSDYTVVNLTALTECQPFVGHFTTKINASYPAGYGFPYPQVVLVNFTATEATFGWSFGTYNPTTNNFITRGYHFYYIGQKWVNGREAVRFISWEKMFSPLVAADHTQFEFGMSYTVTRPDWLGANCLELVWLKYGQLLPELVTEMCTPPPPPPQPPTPQPQPNTSNDSGMVSSKVVAGITVPLAIITIAAVVMCFRYRRDAQRGGAGGNELLDRQSDYQAQRNV